jgi:hypothetical protein
LQHSGWGEFSLEYGFGREMFHHLARNRWSHQARISESIFLLNRSLKIFFTLSGRYEDAERSDYDRWGVGGFLGISALLPEEFNLISWIRMERLHHFDSADSPVWDQSRDDLLYAIHLGLHRPIGRYFQIGISFEHKQNWSRVSLFQYRRELISLVLSGRYSL